MNDEGRVDRRVHEEEGRVGEQDTWETWANADEGKQWGGGRVVIR